MRKKTIKRPLKIFLAVLIVLIVLFAAFIVISCIGSNSNMRYIEENFGAIEYTHERAAYSFNEETGRYIFTKPSDRELRILQLTDTHIGGGIFCQGKDKQAFDAVYTMINGTKPDLVIFTGDVLYPMPFQSGNLNNIKTAEQFLAFMDKLQVPYTMILGNHDAEPYSFAGRERLADIFAADDSEYNLFTKNPKGVSISGYGNQIIEIANADGSLNSALFLFDSHANTKGSLLKYDRIKDDQIEWYRNAVHELSASGGFTEDSPVPSLVFTHIPLNEYADAWANKDKDGNVFLGGVQDEKILAPAVDKKHPKCELFDVMKQLKSTKAVFCGHNHKNNFAVVYEGIELRYSKSIVYLGLNGIHKTDDYRGGTLITVNGDGAYTAVSKSITEYR